MNEPFYFSHVYKMFSWILLSKCFGYLLSFLTNISCQFFVNISSQLEEGNIS